MGETRSYELTHDQVFEICQSLKFQADTLDHQNGSRVEVAMWAKRTASLWLIIDKLLRETPSLLLLPPWAARL